MKKLNFMLVLLLATTCACTDNLSEDVALSNEQPISRSMNTTLTAEEAQQQFAKILSKAVYNHVELRNFLKSKALKQFDNDYDVFYPLVKDEQVDNLGTFREVLLNYIPEVDLSNIEATLPLLNIYVPDLSLFVDVTPENWNTTDQDVPVAIKNQDEPNTLMYLNGEFVDKMPGDEIPDFHFLYIKNNERVRKSRSRSVNGMNGYEFISEVFDGTHPKPQVVASRTIQSRSTSPAYDIDWVPASKIDPVVISAWETMKNDPSLQRDNIYYGMTPTKTEGTLNRAIDEYIYRFQIDPAAYYSIADQKGTGDKKDDPIIKDETISNKVSELSDDEVIRRLWTDGKFEFHFQVFTGTTNIKELTASEYILNLEPKDLFNITITKWHRHHTAFRHTKHYYKIDPNNLGRKWVYPHDLGYDNRLPKWDISTQSLERFFYIYEHDEDEKYETTQSKVTTFTHNFKSNVEGGIGKDEWNVKVGLGYDSTKSTQTSSTLKIETTKGSDQLGTLTFYFYDSIIIEKDTNKGYRPKNVSNGTVTMTIMPMTETFSRVN